MIRIITHETFRGTFHLAWTTGLPDALLGIG